MRRLIATAIGRPGVPEPSSRWRRTGHLPLKGLIGLQGARHLFSFSLPGRNKRRECPSLSIENCELIGFRVQRRRARGASSRIASILWTSLAPLLNQGVRAYSGSACECPGTAKTSRPVSRAKRAVIEEPERSVASTTSTPQESPAMTRFLIGKCMGRGSSRREFGQDGAATPCDLLHQGGVFRG